MLVQRYEIGLGNDGDKSMEMLLVRNKFRVKTGLDATLSKKLALYSRRQKKHDETQFNSPPWFGIICRFCTREKSEKCR
jgi:hypothetical protein